MKYRITTWLAAALMLSSLHATAASLSDIQVSNGDQQARITLSFVGEPGIPLPRRANDWWRWISSRPAYCRDCR